MTQALLPLPGLDLLRDRVLAAVRAADGATVLVLAAELGARPSAVRHHLLCLVAAGEAHQRVVPVPGRGRVAIYHGAPPPAPSSGVRLRLVEDDGRPRTRRDCPEGPCPWFGCRHHLGLHVTSAGTLQVEERYLPSDDDDEPWEPSELCSLRRADGGEASREEVGEALGLTHERVRQIESEALDRLEWRYPELAALLGAVGGAEGWTW